MAKTARHRRLSMIDIRPVGYILGWLVLVLGALMLLPLLLDLQNGDANAEAFALSSVLTIVAGAAVSVACAEDRKASLTLRQGFLLTTGSWAIFPAVGGLPMMLGAPQLSFTDAYFESMSALTTTGATVISGLDYLPRGLLLWRGLLQWLGGMGVILLAMILLPVLNIGGMQLLRNADFNTLGKIMPRTKTIALSIGSVYAGLTLACALGYIWAGMSNFDGIIHAMTTLATGGMGNYDSSFANFSPVGAVHRDRLHAARRHVVQPLRAVRPRRARGAARRQPDPGFPGDLRLIRAGAYRRARAQFRDDRRARGA